jgi:AcrR family transcriptional regulator
MTQRNDVAGAVRTRYHHGDLRAALIDTTIDLLGERGAQAFSMAEASRRLGVATAAPYRHFVDRDALLAAVATRAAELLTKQLETGGGAGTARQRLAMIARTYITFADSQQAMFQALVGSGLDKRGHPDLLCAGERIGTIFFRPVRELCNGDDIAAGRLAAAVIAVVHGHAVLMLDAGSPTGPDAERVADDAAAAVLALIAGRRALVSPGVSPPLAPRARRLPRAAPVAEREHRHAAPR